MDEQQLKDYLHDHLKIKIFNDCNHQKETLAVGIYLDDDMIDYDYIYTTDMPNWYY